jgi:phage terminase large subunit
MDAAERRIIIPYRPRRAFLPFHERTQRWASLNVHRRAGKTVATVNDLIKAAITNQRQWPQPRYAYIAPFYNQAKRIAWGYAKYYCDVIPGRDFNESELKVTFPNGATLRLFGADNPDALRGDYLDGAACDEFADWAPSVFPLVIRPMLADFGGWATFIGTPKGHNEFCEQHRKAEADPDRWFTMTLRASQSGLVAQEELDDARAGMTPEQYEQEFECSFEAAILGAYFGREMADAQRDGRICSLDYDPELPCYTAWDLGKGANMPVWLWQPTRAGPNVIDFVEGVHSDGVPQVLRKVRDKGYPIEAHYVPPDAKTTDIGSGRSRIEQMILHDKDATPRIVPDLKVDDRIAAAKLTLPVTRFDAIRCKDGLEALRQYKADYDEVLKVFRDQPLKNWASHPADAFQCLAGAWRMLEKPAVVKQEERRLNVGFAGGVTFNDIVKPLGARRDSDERV